MWGLSRGQSTDGETINNLRICRSCRLFTTDQVESCSNCGGEADPESRFSREDIRAYVNSTDSKWPSRFVWGVAIAGIGVLLTIVLLFVSLLIALVEANTPATGGIYLLVARAGFAVGVIAFLAGLATASISGWEVYRVTNGISGDEDHGDIAVILRGILALSIFLVVAAIVLSIPLLNLAGILLALYASPNLIKFIRATYNLHKSEGPVETSVELIMADGQRLEAEGSLEPALDSYSVAGILADTMGDSDRKRECAQRVISVRRALLNEGSLDTARCADEIVEELGEAELVPEAIPDDAQSFEEFRTELPYIEDTLVSAENALERDDYDTSSRRFEAALDSIPGAIIGSEEQEALETERQSLYARASEGLIEARRNRLLNELPESLTWVEQEFVNKCLRAWNGGSLATLRDPDADETSDCLLDSSVDDVVELSRRIYEFRSLKSLLQSDPEDSDDHVRVADRILDSHIPTLDSDTSPEMVAETFNEGLSVVHDYTDTVETLELARQMARTEPVQEALSKIGEELTELEGHESGDYFDAVVDIADELISTDEFIRDFPSLPLDSVVADIVMKIEQGDQIQRSAFEEEFTRIHRLVEDEPGEVSVDPGGKNPFTGTDRSSTGSGSLDAGTNRTPTITSGASVSNRSRVEFKQRIQTISPYAFEKVVGEIWTARGWDVTVTQASQDRGIDIIARKASMTEIVQVKRYTADNTVGSDEIRKYATLYQQEQDVNSVAVVTSSSFTSPAEALATDLDVRAINGDDLYEMVQSSGASLEALGESVPTDTEASPPSPEEDFVSVYSQFLEVQNKQAHLHTRISRAAEHDGIEARFAQEGASAQLSFAIEMRNEWADIISEVNKLTVEMEPFPIRIPNQTFSNLIDEQVEGLENLAKALQGGLRYKDELINARLGGTPITPGTLDQVEVPDAPILPEPTIDVAEAKQNQDAKMLSASNEVSRLSDLSDRRTQMIQSATRGSAD